MKPDKTMIGVYDSGLGGVSVLRAVRARLPQHDLSYLADTAYCPYGPRPVTAVRERALACAGWLYEHGARLLVVACNTASSAALELLRAELPIPVVGMEPGIKPAIAATHNGHIAVLATNGTLAGQRYTTLLERFAAHASVAAVPCPLFVEQVEAGDLDGPRTRALVTAYLAPLTARGVDTIVLGCTHFNFLAPLIAEVAGADVTIIDTAPAVARRVVDVAHSHNLPAGEGTLHVATTGTPAEVAPVLGRLWGAPLAVGHADC